MKATIDKEANLTDLFLNKEEREEISSVFPWISFGDGITNPSFDAAKISIGCCTFFK